jgi:glyoxylase-like metal-dependent hydrolase (beta-lactamase superfamily II)
MMEVKTYFDQDTATFSHLVWDDKSMQAAIIDPVLNFDFETGRTSTEAIEIILEDLKALGLTLNYILETHAHADHLSAAPFVKEQCGGQTVIGAKIPAVQEVFKTIFNLDDLAVDGSQFDLLLNEGDSLPLGELTIKALETPGHTPACLSYQIDDAIFVGDTLFSPGYGTARADFPGGDARTLYQSIERLLGFPDDTRLFLCHDYPEAGAPPESVHTVIEHKLRNIHLQGQGMDDYVKLRSDRDAQLELPHLIIPSIQVNIRAGAFPPPESNGVSYLKTPLNQL